MDADGITTGELGRAVALIRGDIGRVTAALEQRPDKEDLRRVEDAALARVAAAVELSDLKNELQDKAIAGLEDWQTWALRLGAPAIVAAVAGVLFNASRLGG